ncbi:MAG: hypothetical protein E3J70_05150 [Candidatus Heimdallarchaeota archaeon]|nr:MAG: hypothetical protein E3J70_05150 [Candidatus Heimdallarchaeota archaeon]
MEGILVLKRISKLFSVIIIICIALAPMLIVKRTKTENPTPFFSITILCPNTNVDRSAWGMLITTELMKIGIGIDEFVHVGWRDIVPRIWGYPGPYPVPTYSEGGYDTLFLGWGWGLDIDFKGIFDTPGITPNGDNFYQYSNLVMDGLISNYDQSWNVASRIPWGKEIQSLLYEDLPSIPIVEPLDVFPHDINFDTNSWDSNLWVHDYQSMENWSIPGQTEFHYAVPSDFEDFHTMLTESVYDAQWTQQIYGGLVERSPVAATPNAYVPFACTSFTSANGLTYQVQIDPDLVFADGEVCNATDVEYSFDLLINPDLYSPDYGFYSQYIDSDTIVINSEFGITVNFLQAYVFQDSNLEIDILPKHIWKDILPENHKNQALTWASNDALDTNIMGIGPYYLDDYDGTNGIIHLKANPYWTDWGGHTAQKFTDVYFEFWNNEGGALSALDAGQIDMIDGLGFYGEITDIPAGAAYSLINDGFVHEIAINMEHPYLGTGELCPIAGPTSANYIRKAIAHVIPRDFIASDIMQGLGKPAISPWPSHSIGYNDSLQEFDYSIETAKSYMEAAGFVYDPTTETTTIYEPTTIIDPTTIFNTTTITPAASIAFGTIFGFLTIIGCTIYLIVRKRERY